MKQEFNQDTCQSGVTNFQNAYKELGIGECSESLVSEVIADGPAKIISAFHKHLNEQLDRDNVTNRKLRDIHINRYYSKVYRLKLAYAALEAADRTQSGSSSPKAPSLLT